MKRGWMISKEVTLLHRKPIRCIYRQNDGTFYAVCVAGRLYFDGPSFEVYSKNAPFV